MRHDDPARGGHLRVSYLGGLVVPSQDWYPWSPVLDESHVWESSGERTFMGEMPIQ